jgi:small subunit ribosomal protein S2
LATVTMKELLEAGVHFGHQVRRWNPKMKEYIFGERNGIYIIDLQKTQRMFREAMKFVTNLTSESTGRSVLFVGTKRQAQDAIKEESQRCGQYYINQRWLGGLLTNFQTIQKSIKRYKEIEAMQADGRIEQFAKKERLGIERERLALEKNLAGIKDMKRLPDAIFVIDTNKEEIAVKEAHRLGIPVIAVVDTNCDPDGVDFVIPGNDDALRAVRLFAARISDAILEGQQLAQQKESEDAAVAAERGTTGASPEQTPRQRRERGGRERGGRDRRNDRSDRGGERRIAPSGEQVSSRPAPAPPPAAATETPAAPPAAPPATGPTTSEVTAEAPAPATAPEAQGEQGAAHDNFTPAPPVEATPAPSGVSAAELV